MTHYPVFLDLRGKPCVVVGGGSVAARKVAALRRAGGEVVVVAPALVAELATLRDAQAIRHLAAQFSAAQLDDAWLAIAATDDAAVNQRVAEAAQARRILVNVVDNPALCSFILPAVVERSPLQIAISTGGASPVLARLLKARLETLIPSAYGRLAGLLASWRARVKQALPEAGARRRFWEDVLQGPIAEQVLAGRDAAAQAALDAALAAPGVSAAGGEVYLVGAGPGDPDLLTFRAQRLMQQADVVLYDRLVAPALLERVRKDAERIYVGKAENRHTLPQAEINRTLVRLARQGKRVLRLKGGDPFIFGRGGEEAEACYAAGVKVEVVPGVSAALGASAAAQIPLTHRDNASIVSFVAGQCKGLSEQNWAGLAGVGRTLVIYMGVASAAPIAEKLMADGLAPTMPLAVIENAARPQMRVLRGELAGLADLVARNHVKSPALIVIGEVAARGDTMELQTIVEAAR